MPWDLIQKGKENRPFPNLIFFLPFLNDVTWHLGLCFGMSSYCCTYLKNRYLKKRIRHNRKTLFPVASLSDFSIAKTVALLFNKLQKTYILIKRTLLNKENLNSF